MFLYPPVHTHTAQRAPRHLIVVLGSRFFSEKKERIAMAAKSQIESLQDIMDRYTPSHKAASVPAARFCDHCHPGCHSCADAGGCADGLAGKRAQIDRREKLDVPAQSSSTSAATKVCLNTNPASLAAAWERPRRMKLPGLAGGACVRAISAATGLPFIDVMITLMCLAIFGPVVVDAGMTCGAVGT